MDQRLARMFAVIGTTVITGAVLAACGGDGDHGGMDSNRPGMSHGGTTSSASDAAFNGTDVKFATDMIAHHRQAIDMAQLAATRAGSQQVKDLAAKIKAAQDPEITTMSGWLRRWGQPVPSPMSSMPGMDHDMPGMDHDMPGMDHGSGMPGMMTDQEMAQLAAASGAAFDRLFLQLMIKHHQGAIEMATTVQRQGQNTEVKRLASKIATDQAGEVTQMQRMLGGSDGAR